MVAIKAQMLDSEETNKRLSTVALGATGNLLPPEALAALNPNNDTIKEDNEESKSSDASPERFKERNPNGLTLVSQDVVDYSRMRTEMKKKICGMVYMKSKRMTENLVEKAWFDNFFPIIQSN